MTLQHFLEENNAVFGYAGHLQSFVFQIEDSWAKVAFPENITEASLIVNYLQPLVNSWKSQQAICETQTYIA